jgi:hypothetical protein
MKQNALVQNALLRGAAAGLAGAVAMTLAEKVEQRITGRPDSYVPGRALLALAGQDPSQRDQPLVANHAMHWMTAISLGVLRGFWAELGLRGPRASLAHTVVRLSTDQTLENASGQGAPPHTWPRDERVVDTLHKAIYSFVTGAVADALVPPRRLSTAGRTSH